jgi:hypothetical protein
MRIEVNLMYSILSVFFFYKKKKKRKKMQVGSKEMQNQTYKLIYEDYDLFCSGIDI